MALAFPTRQRQPHHPGKPTSAPTAKIKPSTSQLTFDCEVTASLHIVQLTDNQLKYIFSVNNTFTSKVISTQIWIRM